MERPAIVLVSDEQVAGVLRAAGYEVVPISSILDCHTRLEKVDADAVVLDGALAEAARRIKELPTFVPVMLIVAPTDVETRIELLRAGADDIVTRPCDAREVVARVEVLLRTRRRLHRPHRATARFAVPRVEPAAVADRDDLTELVRQEPFLARLETAMLEASHRSDPLSVMVIDVDGLADVGARHGQGVSDRLFAACARAVVRACRDVDLVARVDPQPGAGAVEARNAGEGDFVVMLPGVHFVGSAVAAQRVRAEIEDVASLGRGLRIPCHATVGVASYPGRDIESASDIMRFARAALARAKAEGRGHVCLYQHHGYLIQPD